MKLRTFLYLNTKIVEDYISAIDGYIYDEETQLMSDSKEKEINGGAATRIISGTGSNNDRHEKEVKRSVKISDSAKFDKVYKYLNEDDEPLKYYEILSDDIFNEINRDDFIEVLVTARFSKTKTFTDSVKKLAELAEMVEQVTEQTVLDKSSREAINGITALGLLNSKREVTCVFEFEDGKFPLISYLDESYFRCSQESFIGQANMLCKVLRKIPKGKSVKLDEIFDSFKSLPLNREQRRNLPKNMDNPDIIKDVVKGPALVVVPIAVYQ